MGFQPLARGQHTDVQPVAAPGRALVAPDRSFGRCFGARCQGPFEWHSCHAGLLFYVEKIRCCSSVGQLGQPPRPHPQVRGRHVCSTWSNSRKIAQCSAI